MREREKREKDGGKGDARERCYIETWSIYKVSDCLDFLSILTTGRISVNCQLWSVVTWSPRFMLAMAIWPSER